jgi:DNA primase
VKLRIRYSIKTIEAFLKKYVKDYKILPSGEFAINSMFVKDTTYDCRINVEKQCWHDWESGEGGNLVELVAAYCKIDEKEAEKILLDCTGGEKQEEYIPIEKPKEEYKIKEIESPTGYSFEKGSGPLNFKNRAIKLLEKKHVSFQLAQKYKLTWTNVSYLFEINFSHRIIIPTYENGKLVYFQARSYREDSYLPYLNIPATVQPKRYILPFYDMLPTNEALFISEGCWEAIQYNGTYMIGPSISVEQATKIKRLGPKAIYFIIDNDETGRRTLLDNIKTLKILIKCPIYVILWWEGEYNSFKDPTDAGIKDITQFPITKADSTLELKLRTGML